MHAVDLGRPSSACTQQAGSLQAVSAEEWGPLQVKLMPSCCSATAGVCSTVGMVGGQSACIKVNCLHPEHIEAAANII